MRCWCYMVGLVLRLLLVLGGGFVCWWFGGFRGSRASRLVVVLPVLVVLADSLGVLGLVWWRV